MNDTYPITVLIAARNEEANLNKCLDSTAPAERVVIVDSNSEDRTAEIALKHGAEVVQFVWQGNYPKKRQWALDNLDIRTPWVLLLDADEVVTGELWREIGSAIEMGSCDGYLINKGFHFLGQRFRFGGFSHSAVLLVKTGQARFEQIVSCPESGHDMEVHERLIVDGEIGVLQNPLIHEDFKGLKAYIDRHNSYSTWEAQVRDQFMKTGHYGADVIHPKLFGNSQERRRFLKKIALYMPFEPVLWFIYHYIFRLGFLEGRPGFIASILRAHYIRQVRAKIYELERTRSAHSVPVADEMHAQFISPSQSGSEVLT